MGTWGDWKAWGAGLGTAMLSLLEWLVGNPLGPDGHLILLVIMMSLLDFLSGTTAAIATRTWRFQRLKQGIGKLAIWGFMLIIARQCSRPVGVMGGDQLFKFVADYLLIYLILVDLISSLKHVAALSLIWGVEVSFLARLIDVIQRWHDAIPLPSVKKHHGPEMSPTIEPAGLVTQKMPIVEAGAGGAGEEASSSSQSTEPPHPKKRRKGEPQA